MVSWVTAEGVVGDGAADRVEQWFADGGEVAADDDEPWVDHGHQSGQGPTDCLAGVLDDPAYSGSVRGEQARDVAGCDGLVPAFLEQPGDGDGAGDCFEAAPERDFLDWWRRGR